jgi:hypothetical protein
MAFNNYPGQLQAISIIQTVIGGVEILIGLSWGFSVLVLGIATFGVGLLLAPIPLIFLAIGSLSLVSGIKGLQRNTSYGLSLTVAIAQMVMLLACDVISFGCGLTAVILLMQQDVKTYLGK